nr:retrovirus-related Pol polyprotein from transposon TNT 1-94 [Tanacetum cinerariifolium]
MDLQDKGLIDSECSRHTTGNTSYLTDYEEIDGGYVAFGRNPKGGKIIGKDTIKTGNLNFENIPVLHVKRESRTEPLAEAVNIACYVHNKVLVVKPHSKTPYENFHGRTPSLSFMRPFGYPFIILNTIDHLGKFDGKVDEGSGPDWLFNIDALTRIMNYEPIIVEPVKDYILLPIWTADPPFSQDPKCSHDDGFKPSSDDGKKVDEDLTKESEFNDVGGIINSKLPFDPNMPALKDVGIFDFLRDDKDDDAVADMNNLDTTIQVSPTPTIRIHKDHSLDQVIGDLQSATQTKKMSKNLEEHGFEEPKKVIRALKYPSWIEAMLFLAYALFKDLVVYQMGVKSAFFYGKIKEDVYVCQPPEFEDLDFLDRVYKVQKALYGLHQAPRAWYETLSMYMLDNEFQKGKIDKTLFIKRHKGDILLVQVYVDDIIFGSTKKEICIAFEKYEKFQMSSMGELTFFLGLQVKQNKDGKFISQDKYIAEILKKFGFTKVKTASTPMGTQKPMLKDKDGKEVDVHMYRSMIGLLMYLTSSSLDIMFAVCACTRYQVNPKVSHLHDVKRIFRYLKGLPKLGLKDPKDSSFDLVAYTNSDYAEASLNRKSTTGGYQFLGCRLISW